MTSLVQNIMGEYKALVFTCLQYKSFESTAGKGELARNEQFLFFPQCFLPVCITFFHFSSILKLLSANSFSLEESRICRLGKDYRLSLPNKQIVVFIG